MRYLQWSHGCEKNLLLQRSCIALDYLFRLLTIYRLFSDITLKRLQETSHVRGEVPRECFIAAEFLDARVDAVVRIRDAIRNTKTLSDALIDILRKSIVVLYDIIYLKSESELLDSYLNTSRIITRHGRSSGMKRTP